MAKPKFKTAYSNDRSSFSCVGDSCTKQEFRRECDVNTILSRYNRTGLIDHVMKHNGDYADVSSSLDYHDAMNLILNAQESFDLLPSDLRKKFDNNPAAFLDFVHDPANKDALVDMGLAKKPAPASVAQGDTVAGAEPQPAGEEVTNA